MKKKCAKSKKSSFNLFNIYKLVYNTHMLNTPEAQYTNKPDLDINGTPYLDILQKQLYAEQTQRLTEKARQSYLTGFSRYVLATGGGSLGGVIGAGFGAGLGATAGLLLTYGVQGAAEALSTISFPTSSPTELIPPGLIESISNAFPDIQSSIVSAASGISLGAYTARVGWTEGWQRGDKLGMQIGTKLTLPFFRVGSRFNHTPKNLNIFEV